MAEDQSDPDYELARLQIEQERANNETYALDLERRRMDVVEVRNQAFQAAGHAIQYGRMGLQGLGYLNGGALFVLPAFTQLFDGKVSLSALVPPMGWFICGLVLAFIAILFAYLSTANAANQGHSTADMRDYGFTAERLAGRVDAASYISRIEELNTQSHASWQDILKFRKLAIFFEVSSILVAIASLGSFILGAWLGAELMAWTEPFAGIAGIVIDPNFGE
ncbi:MAG: hypothetical protein ABJ388_15155 [Alphaproteobacteria bacterium]